MTLELILLKSPYGPAKSLYQTSLDTGRKTAFSSNKIIHEILQNNAKNDILSKYLSKYIAAAILT